MVKKLKNFLLNSILRLIEKIEKIEFAGFDLDENDPEKKIIRSEKIKNFEILTDTGFKKVSHFHITQPYTHYKIKTETGKTLLAADIHILFDENYKEIYVKDLKKETKIQTINGPEKVVEIIKTNIKTSMADVTVEDENHRYYTNEILSHNTITSGIFLAWYLCFHFDRNVLIVANKQATAAEIVSKIKTIIENLPFFLKPGVISGGALGMRFDNGCRLFSSATTKTAALGYTVHLLYADEFAHIQPNFIIPFYRSIYPTLSSSNISKIIISSTPNGINLFYKIWKGAIEGTNAYYPIKVDWWEVPGRDEEWKKREIANLGSIELFEQEYGNKFIASSTVLLSSNTIEFTAKISKDYVWKELHDFSLLPDEYKDLKWYPNFDPNKVWEPGDKFIISVDLADGVGRDYTVFNIFKLDTFSPAKIRKKKDVAQEQDFFRLIQVGKFHSNVTSVEDAAKILEKIIFELFGPERLRILLEMNFKGNYFVERLSNNPEFYPEIFIHTKHTLKSTVEQLGIKMTKENKQLYCRELKNLMDDKRLIITCQDTLEELMSFGLDANGNFSGQGAHDDLAMSCVLTVPYFSHYAFFEDVEEVIDHVKDKIYNAIYKKLDAVDKTDEDMETIRWLNELGQ